MVVWSRIGVMSGIRTMSPSRFDAMSSSVSQRAGSRTTPPTFDSGGQIPTRSRANSSAPIDLRSRPMVSIAIRPDSVAGFVARHSSGSSRLMRSLTIWTRSLPAPQSR
jgi:hypothetical protein